MALDLESLTEYVWVDEERWKVEQVLSPTPYDDFLILSQTRDSLVHEDGTHPIEIICIDCHNQEFYPDTEDVHTVMEVVRDIQEDYRTTMYEARDKIKDRWLDLVIDEGD